jgi:hypothetical protein
MALKFEKYIVFTPSHFLSFAHVNGQVVLELDVSDKDLGIAPGLGLMISFSPDDARKLADVLRRKADEIEAAQPRN